MSKPNLVKIGPKYSAFYMQTYMWFIVTGETNYPRKPSLRVKLYKAFRLVEVQAIWECQYCYITRKLAILLAIIYG